jgi:hypothetical protein
VIAGAAARETAEIGRTLLISASNQANVHVGKHFREACIIIRIPSLWFQVFLYVHMSTATENILYVLSFIIISMISYHSHDILFTTYARIDVPKRCATYVDGTHIEDMHG